MHLTRLLFFLVLIGLLLSSERNLSAQCANGTIALTGFTSDGGSGTYSDPATGNIEIDYCFNMTFFTELNTNWVHGVFISWEDLPQGAIMYEGPTGSQPTQHGNRFWIFVDSLQAKNMSLPGPGFYVDEGDLNPWNNYGDNGMGTPKAVFPDLASFCFKMKINCGNSLPTAFVPKVTVTGDGTTGAWSNPACSGDVIRSLNDGPNGNGAIVVCGIVLPVKLLEFTGESTKQGNLLKWTAVADNLFSHFVLEVNRDKDNNFHTLQHIDVKGHAGNEIHDYSYVDVNPSSQNLYRLKLVEKDGSFMYSKIISIKQRNAINSTNTFSISPNPASEFIIIHNETDYNFGEIEINIFDLFGKLIRKSNFFSDKSEKDFFFDTSNYAKGMYYVEVTAGSQSIEKLNFLKH